MEDVVLERKGRSYKFGSQFYESKIVTAKSSKVQSKLDKFLSKSWMKTDRSDTFWKFEMDLNLLYKGTNSCQFLNYWINSTFVLYSLRNHLQKSV